MGKIISNGIEYSGLTNINGVFINTNNIVVPLTEYKPSMTYTATEDCCIILYTVFGSNTIIYINSEVVGNFDGSGNFGITNNFYLKKGQIISVANASSSYNSYYIVYGVQQGSTSQGSSSVIDYSTTEQKTGQKWIDGKDIYQKTYAVDISASQTGTVLISDYDYIVKIEAVLNNNSFAFPIFTLASSDYFVAFVDKSTNLLTVLRDNGGSHAGIAYVTIQYTKSTT